MKTIKSILLFESIILLIKMPILLEIAGVISVFSISWNDSGYFDILYSFVMTTIFIAVVYIKRRKISLFALPASFMIYPVVLMLFSNLHAFAYTICYALPFAVITATISTAFYLKDNNIQL